MRFHIIKVRLLSDTLCGLTEFCDLPAAVSEEEMLLDPVSQ